TGVDIEVARAVLEKDADGLGLGLADEGGIARAAAEVDVGADAAVDAGEGVGPFPGHREGGNRAAAATPDGAVVAGVGEVDRPAIGGLLGLDEREQFLEEEAGVVVAQTVVFETAVV